MTTLQDRIEKLVKDILQCGFCVAMGGDVFKSEEENKKLQEEKYNECVAVFSHKIITSIKEVEEETRKEIFEKVGEIVGNEEISLSNNEVDKIWKECVNAERFRIGHSIFLLKQSLSITNKEIKK